MGRTRKGIVSSKIANNSNEYETGILITHSTKRTKQPQHKTHENNEAILESGPDKEALCSPLNVVMRESTIDNQIALEGHRYKLHTLSLPGFHSDIQLKS